MLSSALWSCADAISCGVGERIRHAVPDMAWNFDSVSHISRRTAAMASLKVMPAFEYHAAVFGFSVRDLQRLCVQRVAIEKRPSRTGVVRRIALSDHWRWVSTPRWARVSSKVPVFRIPR
jgi:phosphatidylserine/phosphatidylglycerophosphate/cardiolipin synthase-like enzyme